MYDVVVIKHGPIFDGRAKAALSAFVEDAKKEIASEGAKDIRAQLHPGHGYLTGRYYAHIRAFPDKVTDSGIIYGHWLEGTGSSELPEDAIQGLLHFPKDQAGSAGEGRCHCRARAT
jgi:hypothetical protein